jgi:redox-sensitive bicupin YhaK (pirin superfamily)
MSDSPVLEEIALDFPWVTFDPFLFCAHHRDLYPAGNAALGPDPALLEGRDIGMDFEIRDGFRMYHGHRVPGFPRHPHRGFETVTIARRGLIDHSDSMGARSRFGHGDVQWMTAGRGIVHSEMFPLVNSDAPNPTELFQIWLNLPAEDKLVDSHFAMFWNEDVPRVRAPGSEIALIAGQLGGVPAPAPPPSSWAARSEADVAIWTIRLDAGARVVLPPARARSQRTLYFFAGDSVAVCGETMARHCAIRVVPGEPIELMAGSETVELLLLQGRPIGEPVFQHGPFVMNTRQQILEAIEDYQRTGFGRWPFDRDDPDHGRDTSRFAVHADGRREEPDS